MDLFHLKTYINIYIVKKETGAHFPDFLVSSHLLLSAGVKVSRLYLTVTILAIKTTTTKLPCDAHDQWAICKHN